jgi:hypothetical protein
MMFRSWIQLEASHGRVSLEALSNGTKKPAPDPSDVVRRCTTGQAVGAGPRAFRAMLLACGVLVVIGLASTADAARLRLDWQDNSSNENGFRIARRTEPGGTYAGIAVVSSNVTSYVDTTVTDGETYCYEVVAYNNAGDSFPSNEACATATSATGFTTAPPSNSGTASSTAAGDGGGGGGGGCFIATAAFGSPLAPEVQLLREVRDAYLLPYRPGRAAVQAYYTMSPPIADLISRSETLRAIVRLGLTPILGWAAITRWSPAFGLVIPILPFIAGVVFLARGSRRR